MSNNNPKATLSKSQRNIIQTIAGFISGAISIIGHTEIGQRAIDLLLDTLNIWGTVILAVILGYILYVFRERRRLAYGTFELTFGVITIIAAFMPFDFHYNSDILNTNFYIKIVGGLYVMVRGQDNIVKALKGTATGAWLKERLRVGD